MRVRAWEWRWGSKGEGVRVAAESGRCLSGGGWWRLAAGGWWRRCPLYLPAYLAPLAVPSTPALLLSY